MNRWLLISTLLVTLLNCHSDNSLVLIRDQNLPGTWLLVERGYSPGAGYFIGKIPTSPEQTIVFTANGYMQAQGNDLKAYQAFNQFRLDTLNKAVQIRYTPSVSNYFERIYLNNDTLKLYQSCFEGCHLGFLRIK